MPFFNDYAMGNNRLVRGMRFPKITLGSYTLNLVLQAESCCSKDVSISNWDAGGALGLMTSGSRNDTQKRLGVLGNAAESLTGLYNRGRTVGPVGPLSRLPMIVGFVHKEGRLTVYRNGESLGTFSAISNATTAFEWLNGWLDANVSGSGQFAEIKLYNQPFSADVMKILHDKLNCKWGGLTGLENLGPEWGSCEKAQPPEDDDGGEDGARGIWQYVPQYPGGVTLMTSTDVVHGLGTYGGNVSGLVQQAISTPIIRDGSRTARSTIQLTSDYTATEGPSSAQGFFVLALKYTHPEELPDPQIVFPGALQPAYDIGWVDMGGHRVYLAYFGAPGDVAFWDCGNVGPREVWRGFVEAAVYLEGGMEDKLELDFSYFINITHNTCVP